MFCIESTVRQLRVMKQMLKFLSVDTGQLHGPGVDRKICEIVLKYFGVEVCVCVFPRVSSSQSWGGGVRGGKGRGDMGGGGIFNIRLGKPPRDITDSLQNIKLLNLINFIVARMSTS